VGGSESLAWQYATLLREHFEVDILTTCARDYMTWANDLPPGISERAGIRIQRFPVTIGRHPYWYALHDHFLHLHCAQQQGHGKRRPWRLPLEEEWIRHQGPYSLPLIRHLERRQNEYRALFFVAYLYPTTYFGMDCLPAGRGILVPTLHDEPIAHFGVFRYQALQAREIVWLTEAERRLGQRLWGELPGRVAAMPVATELVKPATSGAPYLLYSGRINEAKGCSQMIDFFFRFQKLHGGKLRLVLTGEDCLGLPKHPDIDFRGYVSVREKLALMAGARVFLMPSRFESFSLATLEAMAQRTPVLVNGACEVLRDHVAQSGGGYVYDDFEGFRAALEEVLARDSLRATMGRRGREYVLERYRPEDVRRHLLDAIDGQPQMACHLRILGHADRRLSKMDFISSAERS
jgi:glycosyltransferase involved in cell wall biosynthesis